MQLRSSVFEDGGVIPQKYGRDFENINPPLEIQDIPSNTKSLVLIMEDPDVPPAAGVPAWNHWVVFNISPANVSIPEAWSVDGIRGKNTRGELEYGGPRPPDREHRYFFTVYALSELLELKEGASKAEILERMKNLLLETAELMGRFAPRGESS